MKIICVIGAFSYGGAEHVMTNLVNYFSDNHEVIYVSLFYRDVPAYKINDKVTVVNGLGFSNSFGAVRKLRVLLKQEKPDIILSFMTHINILSLISSIGLRIPVVVSERADPRRTPNKLHHLLRFLTYRLAKGYVFQTKEAQSYFSETIQRKSTVIANPVFISEDVLDVPVKRNPNKLVAVGRLEDQKNYPMMINAFSKVASAYPDIYLEIFGDGSLKEPLMNHICSLGMENRITLKGNCQDVHMQIKDAGMFIMSTNFEGMPNALMEAMALGICCICTDCPVGGPRELIENEVNGYLIPVADQTALEIRMKEVLDNPSDSENVGKRAAGLLERLNPNEISHKWEQYLIKVLSKYNG